MPNNPRAAAGDITARRTLQMLGKDLLRDAIVRSVEAADLIGARALLVHALNGNDREFCAHFDFEPSPTDPLHLMLLIKDSARGSQG